MICMYAYYVYNIYIYICTYIYIYIYIYVVTRARMIERGCVCSIYVCAHLKKTKIRILLPLFRQGFSHRECNGML